MADVFRKEQNMLKKITSILTAAALFCGIAVGASAENTSENEFTEKKLTTHLFSEDNITEADVRFYDDLPDIPYIRLTDFYSLLMADEKQMSVSESDDGVFTFTSATGASAVIDTDADTLYSDDFENFINTTMKKQDGADNVYYDGSPFIRIGDVTYDKDPDPVNIDFSNYDIDLRADKDDIWLPVLTASDLFSGACMFQCVYDGSELLFFDACNTDYCPDVLMFTKEYLEKIVSAFFRDGKRSPVIAKYCYDELCFMYDTFFGHPGFLEIEDELVEKGLDKTLQTHDKFTAQAREWIKSVDPAEVCAGCIILGDYLCDGHSMPDYIYIPCLYFVDNAKADELLTSIGYEKKPSFYDLRDREYELLKKLRTEARGDDTLVISGDTAVFSFDSFMYDFNSWIKYSKEGGELPDDLITDMKKALEEAKSHPEVKNFVFDISLNGGGSVDVVCLIEAFMTGSAYFGFEDKLTGQKITTRYYADTNFDGVFDEKDKIPYDFNFGILTSNCSFSCGNILPMRARDLGIAVIGERSGGGLCAVIATSSPEGAYYRISSHIRTIDYDGDGKDNGVAVDAELFTVNADGTYDYSDMYDIEAISKAMNAFYSTDQSVDGSSDETEDLSDETEEAGNETVPADNNPSTGTADMNGILILAATSALLAVLTHRKNKE